MDDTRRQGLAWTSRDWTILAGVLAAGAVARVAYVMASGLPRFDPWRHLALVRNLREGQGFTLFDEQPYLWYGPSWYWLCAWLPERIGAQWLAVLLSLGSVALLYALARLVSAEQARDRMGAAIAASLAALCGPVVAYTCHLGAESLALFLAVAAPLCCAISRGRAVAGIAGAAFGLAVMLRANFAFLAPLALPWLATPGRLLAFGFGAALPVAATWLRNHAIIGAHPYLFTWDGLAAPAEGFGPLSTLVPQLHPDIASALRRLHERTMPVPEWLQGPDGVAWELILLMACGLMAVIASRRLVLIASTAAMLGFYLLFDSTLTSNFFRLYLPLLPICFLATAQLATGSTRERRLAGLLAALMLLGGAWSYRPARMPAIEVATPPPNLIEDDDAYLVPSGFFHPASLIYRFPEKRFIGMPLDPTRFEHFRSHFPEYELILWHGYSVQHELGRYLHDSGRYEVVRAGKNRAGRPYRVLRESGGS